MEMIKSFLLGNLWIRALLPLVLMALVGVTASSLVVEIAEGERIRWHLVPQRLSFYLLLIATVASAIYQIALQRHDKDLARGFTPKQYEASIRNRVAEEVAQRSKKLIREGNIDQLQKETETFKRLYGEMQQ
jgi:uncharacterized membrane protein YfcA